jgi:hypothetical protein
MHMTSLMQLSRRDFLRLCGAASVGMVLSACSAAASPIVTTSAVRTVAGTPAAATLTAVHAATRSPSPAATPALAITPAQTAPPAERPTPLPFFRALNGKTPLDWARLLVQNVKPADTSYRHKDTVVTWAGQNGAQSYSSFADCSGFLAALLTQAYGMTTDDFIRWLSKPRPLAEDFYAAIVAGHGVQRVTRIDAARAGDIIAIKYPPGAGGDNTGHIMLMAGSPQRRSASKPLGGVSEQWDVAVIDSSESGHGPEDTRRQPDNTFHDGVGQGTLRIYSDASAGISGYAWSDFANSDYYASAQRPLVIGRIDMEYR